MASKRALDTAIQPAEAVSQWESPVDFPHSDWPRVATSSKCTVRPLWKPAWPADELQLIIMKGTSDIFCFLFFFVFFDFFKTSELAPSRVQDVLRSEFFGCRPRRLDLGKNDPKSINRPNLLWAAWKILSYSLESRFTFLFHAKKFPNKNLQFQFNKTIEKVTEILYDLSGV